MIIHTLTHTLRLFSSILCTCVCIYKLHPLLGFLFYLNKLIEMKKLFANDSFDLNSKLQLKIIFPKLFFK